MIGKFAAPMQVVLLFSGNAESNIKAKNLSKLLFNIKAS
jgi:hypothetical protein